MPEMNQGAGATRKEPRVLDTLAVQDFARDHAADAYRAAVRAHHRQGSLFRATALGLVRAAIVLVFGSCVISVCNGAGMSDLRILANLMVALAALFGGAIGFDRICSDSIGLPSVGSNEEESFP